MILECKELRHPAKGNCSTEVLISTEAFCLENREESDQIISSIVL